MIKIKSIKFKDHDILGNLELDFCDKDGNPADTIIIAGENGTGKTTILEEIYKIMNYESNCKNLELQVLCNNQSYSIIYNGNPVKHSNFFIDYINCNNERKYQKDEKLQQKLKFSSIYSTVNINFVKKDITATTAKELDRKNIQSSKSGDDMATDIAQLIVDVRADDSERIYQAVENNQDTKTVERKFDRFTRAFKIMFNDELKFNKIKNENNIKVILFTKNGNDISIGNLSSGEKQIVFRGAFLLRDKEALNGAVVLIDEPEISMHPEWQNKIMDFYKKIFQNQNGEQTSQIIVTTHSPFIIHNENRYNDKVIVLQKAEKGVKASNKPEYYSVDTIQAVEDAFNLSNFSIDNNENIVFLEGKTDEQYFNKAIEVFGIKNLSFVFKWIGHIGQNNQEEFTGKSALNSAYSFAKGHNSNGIKVFLYDCDAKKSDEQWNNCYIRSISNYNNIKEIKAGIENALVLDDIENFKDFFNNKTEKGNYGEEKIIPEFKKQEFCNYICSLDNKELETILSNLKTEIEKLKELFK